MENDLLLSIVIPTYNSETTLQKCLDSIVSQTFLDFEILIIDGVSKDTTLRIAQGFNDTRIKVLSEPDNGIYDAMNKGIKIAKGEWLYFLGSDDYLYSPSVLNDIFKLNQDDIDVIYGNVFFPKEKIIHHGEFDKYKIADFNICHQSIFYRKLLFIRNGYFDLKYKLFADYDFNLKWLLSSNIKNRYYPNIIAVFSNTGSSSERNDTVFCNDKYIKLIKYGWKQYEISDLKEFARQAYKIKTTNQKYLHVVMLKLLILILRALSVIQKSCN